MPETVILRVLMHCEGCATTVKRACARIPGVEQYTVDYGAQKVTVTGDVNRDVVLKRVLRTGKYAEFEPEAPKIQVQEPKGQVKKEEKEEKGQEVKKAEAPKEEPYPVTFFLGRDFVHKYYFY